MLQATLILTHKPWLDEWQALMIAVQSPSLNDLLGNLRYEGHPPLWYALLRAASAIAGNRYALQAVALVFAAITQWIILFKSPFPRDLRLAIALSEVILFEYNTISRGYTLGISLTFCVLALWNSRRLIWLPLALLPCVDFFFGIFSAIFIAMQARDRWPWLPGMLAWLVLSALSAWTVLPASDNIPAYLPALDSFAAGFRYTFSLSTVAFPFSWEGGPRWDGMLPFNLHIVLWVGFVAMCLEQTRGRALERLALMGFMLSQLAFFILAYPLSSRHVMLTGVLLIAVLWIQALQGVRAERLVRFWLYLLAVLGLAVATLNLAMPFDTGYLAAERIRERGLEHKRWVSYPTLLSPSVTAWNGTVFERVEDGCEQDFVRWNFKPRYRHSDKRAPRVFARWAEDEAKATGRFYVLTRYRLPETPMIRQLDFIRAGYNAFDYRIYEIGPSMADAPRAAYPCVKGMNRWQGVL